MPGKYLRGAFISFVPHFGAPVPNVIIFQYNPESMTHDWTERDGDAKDKSAALSVKGDPDESFSFKLALDAQDVIADQKHTAPIAIVSGIHTRLAALEMLQFPVESKNSGGVVDFKLPLVLFVWGAGRVVPVRVTRLSFTETLFDQFLNPIHADADLSLRSLRQDEIDVLPTTAKSIATAVSTYSKKLRIGLADANLANAAEAAIGMLPI